MTDLSPDLEQLVLAGRSASRPTQADFDRVLGTLRGRLAAVAAGGAIAAAASPDSGMRLLSGKAFAIAIAGVALVVGGVAGFEATRSREPNALVADGHNGSAALPPIAPHSAGSAERVSEAPAPSAVSAPAPISSPPKAPAGIASARESTRSRDTLSEEVAILSRAETELHSGRAESALRVLSEHERRFPTGVLTEERTAARIQALCALGRTSEANAQLGRLGPGSLHGESTRQACGARPSSTTGQPSVSPARK